MGFRNSGELVPGGISGGFIEAAERTHPRLSSPDLGRVAYFSELADRFQNGALTKDEEAELVDYLQRAAVHESL